MPRVRVMRWARGHPIPSSPPPKQTWSSSCWTAPTTTTTAASPATSSRARRRPVVAGERAGGTTAAGAGAGACMAMAWCGSRFLPLRFGITHIHIRAVMHSAALTGPTTNHHTTNHQQEDDDASMDDDASAAIDRETRTLSQRLRRGTQRFLQEPIPLPLLRKYVPRRPRSTHRANQHHHPAFLQHPTNTQSHRPFPTTPSRHPTELSGTSPTRASTCTRA